MIKKHLISIIICLTFQTVKGSIPEKESVKDSIHLNEVIVTGSMTEVNRRYLPMTVSVINSDDIGNWYNSSIMPLLSEEIPGMFVTGRGVMGYGVANGSAGSISIRGIGGSPNTQVLVLIDGHPQYMGMMGHPLPDAYQSPMTQRVEIVRGPASILYGSNAMAGVINIITKKQQTEGAYTHARAMYGSYNTFSAEAGNGYRKEKFSSYVSASYDRTDGQRTNSKFNQYSGYAKLGYEFSNHWNALADVNLTHYNAANPGIITKPIIDNDAEVLRGMTSISLENKYKNTSGALKLFYNFGNHQINDGYFSGDSPKDYLYHSKDNMLGASLYQSYEFFKGNQITAGIDYTRFGGNAWNEFANKNVDIINKHINEVAGYLNFRQILTDKIAVNAGVRLDYNEQTGSEWVPQIGLNYIATESTVLKAIVSKGFRNPTIREMYMFPPQNPNLKPEHLMNYELSAAHTLMNKTLQLALNIYFINGKNLIQTVLENGRPLNINIGKVKNYGLELESTYQINRYLDLTANYSWLHMKYPVTAAPGQQLYIGGKYYRKRWGVSTGLQYINDLYTKVGTQQTKESYVLCNIRASFRPSKTIEFFAKGENVLNQNYMINAGFPMPGATVYSGISLKF